MSLIFIKHKRVLIRTKDRSKSIEKSDKKSDFPNRLSLNFHNLKI